jgi:excisionase family DNA binding protein
MEFYTQEEVAIMLRVHVKTVGRWLKQGDLKGYKLGKGKTASIRIDKEEVDKFIKNSLIK